MKTQVVLLLLAACIGLSTAFSVSYNDAYARLLVKINGAAYAKDAASCVQNIEELTGDWQVIKQIELPCSSNPLIKATCAYFVLHSVSQKQYIISFRGTVGNSQLLLQFLNANPLPFGKYGRVNDYFQEAFNRLWPSVKDTLKVAKQERASVVVTGFSLGGALATITALRSVDEGYSTSDNTYLLTFGSPRVGNAKFADYVDRSLKYRHRVVNEGDKVPHIPPCLEWPFANTCIKDLDYGYYHSQQEIWYPNGSEAQDSIYIATTRGEDPKGSNKLKKYDKKYHLAYFGLNLETYGAINNCQSEEPTTDSY